MATIGSWGKNLVFSTSDSKILTFEKMSRTVSATWVNHSRSGKKDRSEFIRPDLQSVSFTIMLDATLGVRPRTMLNTLAKAVESGEINTLVIGGRKVGSNKFKIKQASEAWDCVLTKGELAQAKVTLTMEEYL
jgi:phage protein U